MDDIKKIISITKEEMNREIIFKNYGLKPVSDHSFAIFNEVLQDCMLDFCCANRTPDLAKKLHIDPEETSNRLLKLLERWRKRRK